MTEPCDDGHINDQERIGKVWRRRGILAAAGAVVAGIAAKQTAQPVMALSDTNYVATGGSGTAFNVATGGYSTGVSTTGSNYGLYSSTAGGYAVFAVTSGTSTPNYAGVYGGASGAGNFGVRGVGASSTSGVGGQSDSGIGVSGTIPATVGIAPPVPNTAPNTIAMKGVNQSTGTGGIGVRGQCDVAGGTGVRGDSTSGFPVIGNVSGLANTAAGMVGAGTVGPGMQGQSLAGHGLVGTTNATDGHAGLVGNAPNAGGVGLIGIAPGYGTQSVGKAAIFYGNVQISGMFVAPVMQAIASHGGDGSYRALSSVLSPESWVEDFGKGTLSANKADIKLDPDFAVLVHADDYHIFVTAYGPQFLYVAQQSATGFTVMAMAGTPVGGPKPAEGSGTFSWRVVAKRKDIAGGRLAKVAAPSAPKTPSAFALPATPVVKPPESKPPTVKP